MLNVNVISKLSCPIFLIWLSPFFAIWTVTADRPFRDFCYMQQNKSASKSQRTLHLTGFEQRKKTVWLFFFLSFREKQKQKNVKIKERVNRKLSRVTIRNKEEKTCKITQSIQVDIEAFIGFLVNAHFFFDFWLVVVVFAFAIIFLARFLWFSLTYFCK